MLLAVLESSLHGGSLPDDASGQEEFQTLREHLTEREDKNRVDDPWLIHVLGHPLSVNGQYEAILDATSPLSLGELIPRYNRFLLEQEVELEAFYLPAHHVSLFAQGRFVMREDLDSDPIDGVSDRYLERGEIWIYAEEISGLPLDVELGRLDFEDDRLWWWDDELDAVRLTCEVEPFEIALAVTRELFSTSTDNNFIAPDQEDVIRLITEMSWDWSPEHAIQLFSLLQDDRSPTPLPGEVLDRDRVDESDAELGWIGIRASGAFDFEENGILGYWLDSGWVRGDERRIEADLLPGQQLEVTDVNHPDVRGWVMDAGFTWLFPIRNEPRLTMGYAWGSGDRDPNDGTDQSFRQTGLHSNEPGFGGVQRFQGYGRLLDPELSNLAVATVGLGVAILDASSIDLVFHDYQLVERAETLRDSRLDAELTGENRELGRGVDLIVGIEEWEAIEFECSASAFRAGAAFGGDEGEWVYGGFFAFRYAF